MSRGPLSQGFENARAWPAADDARLTVMESRSARPAHRARHLGRRILIGVAMLVLVAVAALVHWRIPVAESGLQRLAAHAGFADVAFAIARLDADGAEIDDLRLGTILRIGRVDLDWDWENLLSRPVARLAATGIRIDAAAIRDLIARRAAEGGAADDTTPEAALAPLAVHMPAIAFDPTTVTLPLPGTAGTVTATVQGTVAADRSGAIAAHGRLQLALSRTRIAVVSADDVHLDGDFTLRLADNVLALTLPKPVDLQARQAKVGPATFAPVALKLTGAMSPAARLALDAADSIGSFVAAFDVAGAPVAVRMGDEPAPVTLPLALAGTLHLANRTARFEGRATGTGGAPAIAIEAQQAMAAATGDVKFSLAPLRLGAGGVQPNAVLPALARLAAKSGAVSGETALAWDAAGPHGTARIVFDGASFEDADSGVAVDGLTGAIAFDSLIPLATSPGQKLSIARLDAGVALDNLALGFQLLPDRAGQPAVALESFDAGFAGGKLAVRGGSIGASGDAALSLAVTGVDLGPLLGDVGAEGVGGTGVVDGTIPVRIEQGHIAIEHARLAARGPGRLTMRSAAVRDALAGTGKDVALMLSALEDFRYDRLTLTVEKPADGIAQLRIETFGRNPAVEGGRPFAINLNLETDIDRIAGSLAEALRLPGRIVGAIVRRNR